MMGYVINAQEILDFANLTIEIYFNIMYYESDEIQYVVVFHQIYIMKGG